MRKPVTIFNPLLDKGFQTIDRGIFNLEDYLDDLGAVRSGIELDPNNDLTVNLNSGTLRRYNYDTDSIELASFSYISGLTFDIIDIQGNILTSGATEVDFTIINNNGSTTISTLPQNNDASFPQFYINFSGDVKMLIGQKLYANLNTARQLYFTEKKIIPPILDGYVTIGGFIGRKNTDDIAAANSSYQVYASKLAEIEIASGVVTEDTTVLTGSLQLSGNTTLSTILDITDLEQGGMIEALSSDGNDYEISLADEEQSRIITNVGTNGNLIIKDAFGVILTTILPGESHNVYQRGTTTGGYNLFNLNDAQAVREYFDTPITTQTNFTISTTFPSDTSTVNVYRNGVLMREGLANDFIFSGNTVEFNFPIDNTLSQERVEVSWVKKLGEVLRQTFDSPTNGQTNFTYTLNGGVLPVDTNLIQVYRNGALLREGLTNDYTVLGSDIILNFPIDNTLSQESLIIITNN